MLPIRLIRIALEAETLRLSHKARRTMVRVVLGCFAMALAVGVLVFLHIAVWYWLRQSLEARYVALIFAGVDLVLALILALLAARSVPGRVEREALELRRRALDDITDSLTVSALLLRLIEQLIPRR